jgi:peptidoglycan/xylan/chitin deacetylase (PgdA/CDA1 family)
MAEIQRTERLLSEFDGVAMHDFRPPRGVMPPGMVLTCIRQGRRIAHWSYDSLDYSRRPVEELVESARRHPVRPGDVVLMHDDSDHAGHLLERMLPAWAAEGFVFERLPDAA